MYQPPPAPVPVRASTKASRFAWLPVAVGVGGVAFGAATGGLGYLVVPAALAAGGGGGFWLWRKHKEERAEQQEERFEALALAAFRRHQGSTMTKEQLVRDHRLHPDEADAVLNWLVTHDLLTADWDNYDGPLVYERSDAAAGLKLPEPKPAPRAQSRRKGRSGPVVVHHHHGAPPPHPGVVPEYKSPGIAMLLSFFMPGAGQIYAGNVGRGLKWMFGTWLGYMLFIPGVIVHWANIFNARKTAEEANQYIHQYGALPPPGGPSSMPPPPYPPPPPHRPPGA